MWFGCGSDVARMWLGCGLDVAQMWDVVQKATRKRCAAASEFCFFYFRNIATRGALRYIENFKIANCAVPRWTFRISFIFPARGRGREGPRRRGGAGVGFSVKIPGGGGSPRGGGEGKGAGRCLRGICGWGGVQKCFFRGRDVQGTEGPNSVRKQSRLRFSVSLERMPKLKRSQSFIRIIDRIIATIRITIQLFITHCQYQACGVIDCNVSRSLISR